ncbi:hypothetical protein F5I97DRAFT_1935110 [Phlebopus sp. FC_14]|nr:hypothetical protein F5I97DRAFT_1935110 [Phlebopus sp. FC_14]
MSSPLHAYLLQKYSQAKTCHPAEGRRKWRLRVLQHFWGSPPNVSQYAGANDNVADRPCNDRAEFFTDSDPFDVCSSRPELGLLIRTDFTDDNAWQTFVAALQNSETTFSVAPDQPDEIDQDKPTQEQDDSDSSDDGDGNTSSIFHIVDPSPPQDRALLTNISNLTALRLFNDVDVRPAPIPPYGTGRINPPNRLVDHHQWQEIYVGKNIWIYDAKSNVDQCVRVVSQSGDMYGTATGDSWRARVSHICELQVYLSEGAMKIDFGGLDRWDHNERQRNMHQAEQS